jgi:hypothetical protein
MTDIDFQLLVSRVLAGEASPEDGVQLERTLNQVERRRQFDELRVAWESLREAAPLLEAMDAEPEPMPAESMKSLLAVVRSRQREHPQSQPVALSPWLRALFGRKTAFAAVVALLGFAAYRVFIAEPSPSSGGPAGYLVAAPGQPTVLRHQRVIPTGTPQPLHPGDQIQCRAGDEAWWLKPTGLRHLRGPQSIAVQPGETTGDGSPLGSPDPKSGATSKSMFALALFSPIPALLEANLLSTTRGAEGIAIYSPRTMTARQTPTILWQAEPGATYDLTLQDELDPDAAPWQLVATRPPVRFEAVDAWRDRPLTPDHLYRLTIQRSGQLLTGTEITFSTAETLTPSVGSDPARRLAAACEDLIGEPAKVGDALAELFALPAPYANSELALRLKLLAFGRLGLAEDFERTINQLGQRP